MNQFSSITDDHQSQLDQNQDSSSDQNAEVVISSIMGRLQKALINNVDDDDDDDDDEDDDGDDDSTSKITSPPGKIVVIEHGTEDPIFQKTAEHIKEYLWLIGVRHYITVEINPMSTPRKGSFVISNGDTIYIRLLDLEPPYDELKHLDVNSIAAKIIGFNLKNKLGMM
ncbi:unnamed protein product [Amaranthus hypochondriacus]